MMDLLAEELKLDPLELRAKNLVRIDEMPYKTPLGLTLDPEDYLEVIEKAKHHFRYEGLDNILGYQWIPSRGLVPIPNYILKA